MSRIEKSVEKESRLVVVSEEWGKWEVTIHKCRVSFWVMRIVWNEIVVMAAQFSECAKNH